jgi:hypothetical protein
MIQHLNAQGKLDPRGRLHCFWCPNKTWTPFIDAPGTLKIVKDEIELKKLWLPKVEGSKTQKNKSPKAIMAGSRTPKKFFVCCSIAIRFQDHL